MILRLLYWWNSRFRVVKIPFSVSVSATFAANGDDSICRASIGPTVFGYAWDVSSITTTSTSTTTQYGRTSELLVYQDSESPSSQLFGTGNADNDVATGEFHIPTLSKLVFVWSHGDVGAI